MFRTSRFFTGALLIALALFAPNAFAQSGAGALTGVVYDQTNAVVPNATVTLTNPATGVTRQQQTTNAGVYRFEALPVAVYTLKVEAPGFKTFQVADVVVTVGRVVTQDATLDLGAAIETITVEAGAELVQTSESQVSQLVDQTVWQEMPLEFRNQNEFINLLAGVVPDVFGGTTRGAAVAGARPGTANYMVEGYDNNDQGQGGRGAVVAGAITSISPEAIQEYRVISHAYAAEYGKGGGFVTDTVLKGGTNEVHGSVFWYNRVQKLAANDFFSNSAGLEDARVRNQGGFSLGGPIVKDRAFIFGSYEVNRFREGSGLSATSYTQQFFDFVNSGAFADFHESDPAGLCNQLLSADPSDPAQQVTCPGAFANSRTLGPIVQQLLANWGGSFPFATSNFDNVGRGLFTGGLEYPVPVYGNATAIAKNIFNETRVSLKSDLSLTTNDTVSGTFLYEDSDQTVTGIGGNFATQGLGPDQVSVGSSTVAGISWTHTFTPTILNQARVSYLRHVRDFPNAAGFEGVPSVYTVFDGATVDFGNSSSFPQTFTDNQFQYQDHLSIVKGSHTFKVGGEYRRTRNGSAFEAFRNGFFAFHGVEEIVTDGFFSEEADQLLGTAFGAFTFTLAAVDPTTGLFPEFYRGYRANEFAGYVQDDWRVSPRLTLNYGLRWEYFGVPHNFREGLDSNFFFGSGVTPIPSTGNVFFPVNSGEAARVFNGDFDQRDRNIWAKDTNNFAPRFGFTYDLTGEKKLVLRGGAGIFYDRLYNNVFENIRFNQPFFCFCGFGSFFTGVPGGPISTPGVYTVPFTSTAIYADPNVVGIPSGSARHMDEDLVTAYWQQYYLGLQWKFAPDFVLETNYVSTLGRKLHGIRDINTFNGRTNGGTGARINPVMSSDNFRHNGFKSNYHGLQVNLTKRFSYGLQFNTNYTYGHAIDELSDAFNSGRTLVNLFRPVDNFDNSLNRGSADFDIRHRSVTSFYYELPVWKNHPLAGGWAISGIFTAQTGVPLPLHDSGTDPNADGWFVDRPIFVGSGDVGSIGGGNPADGFFDTANFRQFAGLSDCQAFGNGQIASSTQFWCNPPLGRGVLYGPEFVNADFSVQKKFRIGERIGLEFQANFFNIFNHSQFDVPISNFSSANFGRTINTVNNPRLTQLAVRIDF